MKEYFSRKTSVEQRKNKKRILLYIILSAFSICSILIFGIPLVVNYLSFFLDLKNTNTDIQISDSTPPPPPSFEPFSEWTNTESVEIKGRTEPGVYVYLKINNKEIELLSDNGGYFSHTLSLVSDQTNIFAYSKDPSGNTSKEIKAGTIILDKKPPELTIVSPADGSEYFGSLARQLTITGKSENDVKLNINGRLIVVNNEGNFSYTTTLTEGENNFLITSEDRAGNKSETSLKIYYSL